MPGKIATLILLAPWGWPGVLTARHVESETDVAKGENGFESGWIVRYQGRRSLSHFKPRETTHITAQKDKEVPPHLAGWLARKQRQTTTAHACPLHLAQHAGD
jgi:hypothetical protein